MNGLAQGAREPGTTLIRLAGGALGFNWLPVFIGEEAGIFGRRGVGVELQRMGSVDKATAAVRAGDADLAITPPEGAIADGVRGGELRIVAGNVNRLPLTLVANPKFQRIADLRGARLGTSSMTEGTAIYTREMLAQHGLHYPGDYEFAVVGVHPARWQALQEERIEAAVQLIPLNFVAIDAGYTNLGEVSDVIPEIVFTALVGKGAWIADNEAAVLGLLSGLIEATDFIHDPANDEATLPTVMRITGADEAYARRSLDYMRTKGVFSRDLGIPETARNKTVELMIKASLLDPSARDAVASLFDLRLAKRAHDALDAGFRN